MAICYILLQLVVILSQILLRHDCNACARCTGFCKRCLCFNDPTACSGHTHARLQPHTHSTMPRLTPQYKHGILTHYHARTRGCGFHALATRFAIPGGASTIRKWYQRWNGTPQSLQPHRSTGRPRALAAAQISRYIRAPVLAANRAHRAIHYTTLLDSIRRRTGAQVSLPTVRRLGRQALHASNRRTVRRTSQERRQLHTTTFIAFALP